MILLVRDGFNVRNVERSRQIVIGACDAVPPDVTCLSVLRGSWWTSRASSVNERFRFGIFLTFARYGMRCRSVERPFLSSGGETPNVSDINV